MKAHEEFAPESLFGKCAGLSTLIQTFSRDVHLSEVYASSYVEGYYLIIHSVKRRLWSLQSQSGVLVGVGNPFDNYQEHIITLPREVRLLLMVEFAKYKFPLHDEDALMFILNNTARLLPTKDKSLFTLVTPDNKAFVLTNPYVEPSPFDPEFMKGFFGRLGESMGKWLKDQFSFINAKRKMFANARKADQEIETRN